MDNNINIKKEYFTLKGKPRFSDHYHRIPNTPDFESHFDASEFYRDNCDKDYFKLHLYEDISVYKRFEVHDQFVFHLKNTPKKTKFKPRPLKPKSLKSKPFNSQTESYKKWAEEVKQTIANSRESTEIARNKVESKPYTL